MPAWLVNYVSVVGRLSRGQFLRAYRVVILVGAVNTVVGILLVSNGVRLAGFAAAGLFATLVLSTYGLTIRRLHDRGRSGAWAVLSLLIAFLSVAVPVLAVFGLLFHLWLMVETFLLRGDRGPNRFGPDPVPPTA